MKLSIIIVSWNVSRELLDCLDSIAENKPSHSYEIIVIDNASTDGTIDAVQKDFPEVKLIINKENRGFAAANNLGVEQSKGEYILFLNPDTILHRNALDILIDFLDSNKDAGACGPKLLNDDGTIQPSARRFPDFYSALYQNSIFRNVGLFRKQYRRYRMNDFNFDVQKDVDILMGAAIMTRRSIIDNIGSMDEVFFMYYEEADLCYRIVKAGWRVVFIPEAIITHLGGRSSDQLPVKTRIMRLKSLLIFFRKHYGKIKTGIFNCIFKPAVILRYVCNIISGFFVYIFAVTTLNKKLRKKCVIKIKDSGLLLRKYSWELLFKI
jgi:GT2 family glycosyltransferase